MNPIIFSSPEEKPLAEILIKKLNLQRGILEIRQFPDEETYIKLISEVKGRRVIFLQSLDKPNQKILPFIFAAECARELGAKEIGLIAPYLSYMRQDKRFNEGEAITSRYFAKLLSHYLDWIIAIEPHLHRYHSLNEIYNIKAFALLATKPIVSWIKENVSDPLIIGPDRESRTMVSSIATLLNAPFVVCQKLRKTDKEVQTELPNIEAYYPLTPVVVDDVISTGKTMIGVLKQLKQLKMKPAFCIGIHGVFSGSAYTELSAENVKAILTCNTISHPTNGIDISDILIECLGNFPE